MDKSYNDEMYLYLTKPENYNAAAELSENLKQIEQKLRDEFWEMVTLKIKTHFENEKLSNQTNLNALTKYDKTTINNDLPEWFQIEKNDWEFYFISTEKEDIGVRRKNYNAEELKLYESAIKVIIQEKSKVGNYRNITWPCWKTFNNYRFVNKEQINAILPEIRDNKINECFNEIEKYITDCITVCDRINSEITKLKTPQI